MNPPAGIPGQNSCKYVSNIRMNSRYHMDTNPNYRRPIRDRRTSSHYKLFVHLTWHTKNNAQILTSRIFQECNRFMRTKCREIGASILIIGGIANHLHVLISYPPKLSVSDLAHDLKGGLSRHINNCTNLGLIYWQDGFGSFSVSPDDVDGIYRYIRNQKAHHNYQPGD